MPSSNKSDNSAPVLAVPTNLSAADALALPLYAKMARHGAFTDVEGLSEEMSAMIKRAIADANPVLS